MTCIPHPVASTALARPEHVVLQTAETTLTARALLQAVRQRAAVFAQAGIKAGARAAIMGPSGADFVISLHALGWLGAAASPIFIGAPVPEVARHLAAIQAQWLILGTAVTPKKQVALRQAVGAKVSVLQADTQPDPHDGGSSLPWPHERFWPLDEVRLVLLSSGSTGAPHAVALTTAQLLFSAFGSATRLGHSADDCWLGCLPLHHIGGLSILFRAAWFGVAVELPSVFEAQAVAARLDSGAVALTALVPSMLQKVLAARPPVAFPPRLRAILLGGAPAPAALLETCTRLQLPVCVSWGMTETASQVATAWPGEIGPLGDCGPPLPFARVSLESANQMGRLSIAGPIVGAAPLVTRDCGRLDAQQRVHVYARDDDVIISGGENIAPFEVESVLLACPGIADAAVVGIADRRWGQRAVAVLVASGADILHDAALVAWCRGHLASFKVPAQFIWCRVLPRDALGKLRRQQVLPLAHRGVEDA